MKSDRPSELVSFGLDDFLFHGLRPLDLELISIHFVAAKSHVNCLPFLLLDTETPKLCIRILCPLTSIVL
jgi:hypothetical protein